MNWERSRHVTRRWFIEGTLELLTPTILSNGDDDPLVDLPIVVDPLEGRALLTGASLAGALRPPTWPSTARAMPRLSSAARGSAPARKARLSLTTRWAAGRGSNSGTESASTRQRARPKRRSGMTGNCWPRGRHLT